MKLLTILGILLVVAGALALAYQGISYTTEEEIADIGPLEIKQEKEETIPLPPVLGILSLVGGIALIYMGGRR